MRPIALLVGISDYDSLADTLARAPEDLALPGAPNDVLRMGACCARLGADPEDILVLSGEVSAEELRAGLRWLATRLAEDGTMGLFHFSGHGLRSGHAGWAIVPSDGGAQGQWNAITLAEIRVTLDEYAPERDLTILLDACTDDDLDLAALLPDDAVLYLGCAKTPELNLGGTRQGALSWALSTVLERWTWDQSGPSAPRAAVGAAGLLDALQTGVDLRSSKLTEAAFLAGRAGARTEPAPAAAFRQLDPETDGYKMTNDPQPGNPERTIGWIDSDHGTNTERWHRAGPPNNQNPLPNRWILHPAQPGMPPGGWTIFPHRVFSTGTQLVVLNKQNGDQLFIGRKFDGGKALNGRCWVLLRGGDPWAPAAIEWYCTDDFMPPSDVVIKLIGEEHIHFTLTPDDPTVQVRVLT